MSLSEELLEGFRAVSVRTIYREIRHSDYWPDYLKMERHPGTTDKRLIERWIEDRRADFLWDFEDQVQEMAGKLVIYRCIDVPDPEEFAFMVMAGAIDPKYEGLGIYWSFSLEKAECHWGQARRDVFLKALVDKQYIDRMATVLANMDPQSGAAEAEIRLRDGSPLEIVGIGFSEERRGALQWLESEAGSGVVLPA